MCCNYFCLIIYFLRVIISYSLSIQAHLYEGEKYTGPRTLENLKEFVLSKVSVEVKLITPKDWDHSGFRKEQWLLFLCPEGSSSCPEYETRLKLAASLV